MGVLCGAKPGIRYLSELIIDCDKNWLGYGIHNIKQVAAGMAIGHVLQHNGSILEGLPPGVAHYVLTSEGLGKKVIWAPGGTYYERFFPVSIDLSHKEGKVTPDAVKQIIAAMATSHVETYLDAPGDFVKRLTPTIELSKQAGKVTPDHTHGETPVIESSYSLKIPVGGAVADDGGVQMDETTEGQNDTQNDMTLLPATPAVDDAYYLGDDKQFDAGWLDIGTQGDGVWVIAWEYWNGSNWVALADVVDNTNSLTAIVGWHDVSFTRPGDWALTTIQGMSLYWIRARVSSFTSIITQPLGNQALVEIYG
jgi:hypothetical protein